MEIDNCEDAPPQTDEPLQQKQTAPNVQKWQLLTDENYNSDEEGARPLRDEWPETSLLSRDHFTIDQQPCLACEKLLGYAMPMNREPNPIFLFCDEDCRNTASFLKCLSCGNFNNQTTGSIVKRPGNSAYNGQSEIYMFMCFYCHKEMMENEPGVEETATAMQRYRELRSDANQQERIIEGAVASAIGPGGGGSVGASSSSTSSATGAIFNSFFPSAETSRLQQAASSKKRKLSEKTNIESE